MYIIVKTLLHHISAYVYHHQGAEMPKLTPTPGGITMLQQTMTEVYYNNKIKLKTIKNIGIEM